MVAVQPARTHRNTGIILNMQRKSTDTASVLQENNPGGSDEIIHHLISFVKYQEKGR
jgi:hypothetical protein